MREKYEIPEMEVIAFETEDIITTSGGLNELDKLPLSNFSELTDIF